MGYYPRILRIGQAGGRSHDWRKGNFERDLTRFTHEFVHSHAAYLSYVRDDGTRGRLFADSSADELPNATGGTRFMLRPRFPGAGNEAPSLMTGGEGGGFWRDNGDGTFTAVTRFGGASGLSWLDLYAMGLAEASEVPDMFVLRNLEPVAGNDSPRWSGQYRGTFHADKEIISIDQIVAAMGPREPPAARSRKEFNTGFVYLLEPGQAATPELLQLHKVYIDRVVEYWSHITGGRSRLSTTISNPAPPPDRGCVANAETLCLHSGRYEVRVDWWTGDGEAGSAQVVPEATEDSGLFRFFDANNWEILVKVLDGCVVNGHYWVYGASTTNLGYVIHVTDTATGDVQEYRNEPGQSAAAITDAKAFPGQLLAVER